MIMTKVSKQGLATIEWVLPASEKSQHHRLPVDLNGFASAKV